MSITYWILQHTIYLHTQVIFLGTSVCRFSKELSMQWLFVTVDFLFISKIGFFFFLTDKCKAGNYFHWCIWATDERQKTNQRASRLTEKEETETEEASAETEEEDKEEDKEEAEAEEVKEETEEKEEAEKEETPEDEKETPKKKTK